MENNWVGFFFPKSFDITLTATDSTDKYSEALGVVAEKDLIFINVVCLLISYS